MTARESLILKSQVNVLSSVQQFTLMVAPIINYWFFFTLQWNISIIKKLSTIIIWTCTIRRVNIFHCKNKITGFLFFFFFCMIFQCLIGILKTKIYIKKACIKNIDLILLYLYIFMNTIYTSGSLWFLCNFNQGRQLCWNVSYHLTIWNREKRGFF